MIGGHRKFTVEKNFEVENFQLLTMIFSGNILSMEIFLEWAPLMPDNFTRQEEIAGVQWVKQICLSNGMHCLTVYLSTRLGQLGGGG